MRGFHKVKPKQNYQNLSYLTLKETKLNGLVFGTLLSQRFPKTHSLKLVYILEVDRYPDVYKNTDIPKGGFQK